MLIRHASLPFTSSRGPARPLPLPLRHPTLVPLAAQTDLPQQNQLLATLGAANGPNWRPPMERVEMRLGQVLCESGCRNSHVYFPTSSIVSLLSLTADGFGAEVATVGNDGMVGLPLLMGSLSANGRAVVDSAGYGYRVNTQLVLDEFSRGGAVMKLLLHYGQALLTQVAQTAVCNRHHAVDRQLCRLLLLSLDRVQGRWLKMTHELLAGKLGVRRESVTMAAQALQRDGVIRYARGLIEVLDRDALQGRACECYVTVKRECDRLLPQPLARSPCLLEAPRCDAHCA